MKRMRWEYLVTGEDEPLTSLGEAGWELVAVIIVAGMEKRYFKRPAPSLSEELTMSQRATALNEQERES